MDSKKTGALIAKIRKEKHMTQKQLAELLHVSDKAISRWESGYGFPETSLLPSLARVLEISVDELLKGEIENKAKEENTVYPTYHPLTKVEEWIVKILKVTSILILVIGFFRGYDEGEIQQTINHQIAEIFIWKKAILVWIIYMIISVWIYFLAKKIEYRDIEEYNRKNKENS